MNSPNNGGEPPSSRLLSLNKASRTGIGLHLTESLAKDVKQPGLTPQDETHTWYSLGDQEPETRQPKNLRENQILLV